MKNAFLALLLLRGVARSTREPPKLVKGETVVNVLIGVFAILLCVINAAVWAFVTGLPFMGAAWMLGAATCVKLQKWSRS